MTTVTKSKKPVYRRVSPTFWTGETGKAIRGRGSEAVLVANFLMSSPDANMIGLYHQPVMFIGYYTALGIEGAAKGLQACQEVGFCDYDPVAEVVWVREMAKWQIEEQLSPADLRCKGIQREYDSVPKNRFLGAFFDRYAKAFNMTARRAGPAEDPQATLFGGNSGEAPLKPGTGTGTGTEAGPGPLAGQGGAGEAAAPPPPAGRKKRAKAPTAPKPEAAKPSKRVPSEWLVSVDLQRWAREKVPGVDIRAETEAFRDFEFSRGHVDWDATWRTWMRNAAKGGPKRPAAAASAPAQPAPERTAAAKRMAFGDRPQQEVLHG